MSEEKPKPAYYAIIPASVRYDSTLPPNAKLLYGEITALCTLEGFCWATNRYFAELYGVKIRAVQSWIDALKTSGHILVDPIDGYKRHIRLPEAERAARVQKDTRAKKDTPHAEKDMGGMTQKTPRRVPKDTHNTTESLTRNTTITSEGSLSLLEQEKRRRNVSSLTREHLNTLCREYGWPRVSAEMRAVLEALAAQGQPTARPLAMYREMETEWRQKKAG